MLPNAVMPMVPRWRWSKQTAALRARFHFGCPRARAILERALWGLAGGASHRNLRLPVLVIKGAQAAVKVDQSDRFSGLGYWLLSGSCEEV